MGAGGRGFESLCPDQFFQSLSIVLDIHSELRGRGRIPTLVHDLFCADVLFLDRLHPRPTLEKTSFALHLCALDVAPRGVRRTVARQRNNAQFLLSLRRRALSGRRAGMQQASANRAARLLSRPAHAHARRA